MKSQDFKERIKLIIFAGNNGSALVEVLVGRSSCSSDEQFQVGSIQNVFGPLVLWLIAVLLSLFHMWHQQICISFVINLFTNAKQTLKKFQKVTSSKWFLFLINNRWSLMRPKAKLAITLSALKGNLGCWPKLTLNCSK